MHVWKSIFPYIDEYLWRFFNMSFQIRSPPMDFSGIGSHKISFNYFSLQVSLFKISSKFVVFTFSRMLSTVTKYQLKNSAFCQR